MASNVWNFLHNSKHSGLASVIALAFFSFAHFIPCNALCFVDKTNSLQILDSLDAENLEEKFNNLEQVISKSDNPTTESEKFLNAFLMEFESNYGIKLTIQEACQIVKENVNNFQFPEEIRASLLNTIQFFAKEKDQNIPAQVINSKPNSQALFITPGLTTIYNPFIAKKNHKRKHIKEKHKQTASIPLLIDPDVELPGNAIVGGVEIFVGVLICIIPHPTTFRIGLGMILDGGRRVVDGWIQAEDEERLSRMHSNLPTINRSEDEDIDEIFGNNNN